MSSPSIRLIPTGAILQEFLIGSNPRNIVLSFNTASEYATSSCYFGATIGRVANRIKDAKVTDLGGNTWEWNGPTPVNIDGKECVVFAYTSPHLDEGFPGEVEVKVRYDATEEGGKVSMEVEYEARLVGGVGIPLDDSAAPYLGIEANMIVCFPDDIADPSSVPIDTRGLPLPTCAKFYHPGSGFYTGKYVDVEEMRDGTERRVPRGGFCMEPSRFVDAVSRDGWKGMVYGSRIVFTAWEGDST
ncbi:galactose mutarotase-like domain-containing protein [Trichophaea hybrida]|nr:galactose mutarotase-like domain-containing protein [Trichophaea hybrida]